MHNYEQSAHVVHDLHACLLVFNMGSADYFTASGNIFYMIFVTMYLVWLAILCIFAYIYVEKILHSYCLTN